MATRMRSLFCSLMLLVVACPSTPQPPAANPAECVSEQGDGVDYFPDQVSFEHATGVEVTYHETYKQVTVSRPWSGATTPLEYALVQCGTDVPEEVDEDVTIIEVPVDEIVTMSATYIPPLEMLDALDRLAGVGTPDYVYSPAVHQLVDSGAVVATGENATADLERLVELDPDLVMTYSFGDLAADGIDQMVQAGLPVVMSGEHTENTPLGRAEWVKFMALFTNQEAQATALFDDVVADYEDLAGRAAAESTQPSAFVATPFEGTWFMPRGDSSAAQLLSDAGIRYVYAGETGTAEGTGNLALDIEAVLERAGDADLWLNAGIGASTLAELAALDERFTNFAAFNSGEVYAETARANDAGLVDFYETGPLRPDLVLADLVAIAHPELLPDHELYYFRKLPA